MMKDFQTEGVTFDTLPEAFDYVIQRVNLLHSLIEQRVCNDCAKQTTPTKEDKWMDITQLCEYLPEKPKKFTVYNWVAAHYIPFYKSGKKLSFLRSDIDAWLKDRRQKTDAEYMAEAEDYVNAKRLSK